MRRLVKLVGGIACATLLAGLLRPPAAAQARLDLGGFAHADGAITTLRGGDIVDPYFAIQALLLAQENGLDATDAIQRWAAWLAARQSPDGTFARFCRAATGWVACKRADADDALLAMWIKLLGTDAAAGAPSSLLGPSLQRSVAALGQLVDPARGVYRVSAAVPYSLFMDNLEVWSFWTSRHDRGAQATAGALQRAIQDAFWRPADGRFLVSTQAEQVTQPWAFYPDAVAHVYPLLFDYPALPAPAGAYYAAWMRAQRAAWLAQGPRDFAWGVIALVALRQHDLESARCWLRATAHLRHSTHWTVADETVRQILEARGLGPAPAAAACA